MKKTPRAPLSERKKHIVRDPSTRIQIGTIVAQSIIAQYQRLLVPIQWHGEQENLYIYTQSNAARNHRQLTERLGHFWFRAKTWEYQRNPNKKRDAIQHRMILMTTPHKPDFGKCAWKILWEAKRQGHPIHIEPNPWAYYKYLSGQTPSPENQALWNKDPIFRKVFCYMTTRPNCRYENIKIDEVFQKALELQKTLQAELPKRMRAGLAQGWIPAKTAVMIHHYLTDVLDNKERSTAINILTSCPKWLFTNKIHLNYELLILWKHETRLRPATRKVWYPRLTDPEFQATIWRLRIPNPYATHTLSQAWELHLNAHGANLHNNAGIQYRPPLIINPRDLKLPAGTIIKQLLTTKDLSKEGQDMHHCIISYASCFHAVILHVSHPESKTKATTLISNDYSQSRGPCNSLNWLTEWIESNLVPQIQHELR